MFDRFRAVGRRIVAPGNWLTLAVGLIAMAAGIYLFDFSGGLQLLGYLVLFAGSYLIGRKLLDHRHHRRPKP